jgi:hypothetical protein
LGTHGGRRLIFPVKIRGAVNFSGAWSSKRLVNRRAVLKSLVALPFAATPLMTRPREGFA